MEKRISFVHSHSIVALIDNLNIYFFFVFTLKFIKALSFFSHNSLRVFPIICVVNIWIRFLHIYFYNFFIIIFNIDRDSWKCERIFPWEMSFFIVIKCCWNCSEKCNLKKNSLPLHKVIFKPSSVVFFLFVYNRQQHSTGLTTLILFVVRLAFHSSLLSVPFDDFSSSHFFPWIKNSFHEQKKNMKDS